MKRFCQKEKTSLPKIVKKRGDVVFRCLVGKIETSRACLLPDSLGARELRSEVVDSKAFNGILLEEKILDLARQVGRLLLRQKHLRREENRWKNRSWNLRFVATCYMR